MALSSFAVTGAGDVTVGPTPLAVQVSGSTVLITNLGFVTCWASLGGSAPSAANPATGQLTGLPVGQAGSSGNVATATGGVAVEGFPAPPVALAIGSNGFLWLATIAGQTVVNVAVGT